jgi:hypothetical protein
MSNQPTRRSQATVLNDFREAINEIKRIASKPTPQLITLTPIKHKFGIGASFMRTLAQMKYITMFNASAGGHTGKAGNLRAYQWTHGAEEVDLDAFYSLYLKNEIDRKAGKTEKIEPELKVVIQPKSQSTNTKPKLPKAAPVQKEIKGTIFGYKQLKFIGETFRKSPTTVLIDDRFTIENVSLIRYDVEKGTLIVSFYMYADKLTREIDETSLIGRFTMENVVLALKEAFVDDARKISNLKIYTIPVTDPYNITM